MHEEIRRFRRPILNRSTRPDALSGDRFSLEARHGGQIEKPWLPVMLTIRD
jgi:hypothetical protein